MGYKGVVPSMMRFSSWAVVFFLRMNRSNVPLVQTSKWSKLVESGPKCVRLVLTSEIDCEASSENEANMKQVLPKNYLSFELCRLKVFIDFVEIKCKNKELD